MTLRRHSPRAKTRWGLLAAVVACMTLALVASSLAVHDVGEFELDKNASNDTNITKLGNLAANITAGATSLNICQTASAPATPFSIQLEAERLTVTANNAGSFGGNCGGEKRTYTITRAQAGTTATAHAKGGVDGIISLVVSQAKDGPDWDQVYAAVQADPATNCAGLGLVECSFVHDGIGPTTFTGGATKDHLPIGGWSHTSGASPDKGEILNAFAAKAIDDDDDQILYFGMDRYAVDGSTDIGFWFFQQPVGTNADGTFSGEHVENDVLILGTFTQGGATSDIRVFKWVDSGGNEQENIEGPTGAFGDCVPGSAGDQGCATVNDSSIPVPWTYTFKGSAKSGWVPAGGAFEGGVNLTEIGLEGCFSSFLAETRSSPSITAILKDFALGSFEACDTELTTTPSAGSGGSVSIGTGTVAVHDSADLDVKGTSTWSGSLDFYLCGPLASGELCETGGVQIGSTIAVDQETPQPIDSASANVTEVGRYCWRGEFTSTTEGVPDATDASEGECFDVAPVTPTLDTEAVASPVDFGQPVQDNASLTGTATQPGTNGPDASYPSINATNGAPAGGNITFFLYGPDDCQALANGFPAGGLSETVSGDGTYGPVSFTPDAPGEYYWKAVYNPAIDDPNNIGSVHNAACDDANETVVVEQVPTTITTRQFVYPNDKAQIAAVAGGELSGSVTFDLYGSLSDCENEADVLYSEGPLAISGASPQTAATSNSTYAVTSDATVYWRVTYASANPAQLGSSSVCVESTAVDYTGDDGTITVP